MEIDTVNIPEESEGGNRARLLSFAERMMKKDLHIAFFVDADFDGILCWPLLPNVWTTDNHDLEGYLLREDCFDKALRLGVCVEEISASFLLANVLKYGRVLGLLRILSEVDSLGLPFKKAKLYKSISYDGNSIELNLEKYIKTLLQKASISLSQYDKIITRLKRLKRQFSSISDLKIIHGKDALEIFDEVLRRYDISRGDGSAILWTSFQSDLVAEYPNLRIALQFISNNN